jgi:hypothetical protein
MNVKSILGSKLAAAEANFNSAFGVLEKIQTSAENAEAVAQNEAAKAEHKKREYEIKEIEMRAKAGFYSNRAAKVRKFIASLND